MPDKKPPKLPHALYPDVVAQSTPIPLRASRKKSPEPLVLHTQPSLDERIKSLVAAYVARLLYKTALQMTEIEIIEMGEQQFEAFCRSVLQDEDNK